MKKKSNAMVYHFVREGVAQDEWQTAYVNMDENLADLLTKLLSGPKQASLFEWFCIMFSQKKGMGIWEEIKSFLLPPRIGTTYPFAHTV